MKKNIKIYITIILMIINILSLSLFSYSLILYKNVETFYRIFGILILAYFLILLSYLTLMSAIKKKKKRFIIFSILIILFSSIQFTGYYYLNKIYKTIDSYSKNENIYSSVLVTYDLKLKNEKDLLNKKIGIITDQNDIEGYQIPNEIIKDLKLKESNTIIEYTSTMDLLYGFKNKEIDVAFFSSNYVEMFSPIEGFETIQEETKIIYTKEKEIKTTEDEIKSNTASFTKPFTVLIIGVDASKDGVTSGYNADVLQLITFNPQTLNATMTSIPRDMYLQTACSGGQYRRINTTTWGSSSSCAVQTIERLFDVDIDYYAKINFKGVVQLVDALGGITVDVPYSFCEQNSSRNWGSNTVFVEKGIQKLNGEQALALARNRHKPNDGSAAGKAMGKYCPTYNAGSRNDYTRGKNQTKIIQAILSQATKLKDPNQALDILEKIKANFQTNVTTNDILSLYDLGKSLVISDATNLINIKRLQLTGKSGWGMIYEESSKSYPAVTLPYQESISEIKKEISINLGKKQQTQIKKISFDINNKYESPLLGKGNYSNVNISTLKDLSTYSIPRLKEYANSVKKDLKIIDYDTNEELNIENYGEYYFFLQKEHKDTILNQIKTITIYVKKSNLEIEKPQDQENQENQKEPEIPGSPEVSTKSE